MRTRHLAGALAGFIAALSLAACGGGGDATSAAADRHEPAAVADGSGSNAAAAAITGVALAADAGMRGIRLSWSSNGASQYNVYLSSARGCDIARYTQCPDGRLLANVRSPYAIEGLVNGRAYYARVEGVHATGRSLSNEAGARPGALAFNDTVRALATAADGTTYVGGDFTHVGITSGNGVAVEAQSGRPKAPDFAIVAGDVNVAVPDGAGGWFIGGGFKRVGAVDKKYLAHLRADGSLDPNWNPVPDGSVWAMAAMDGVLYIGGSFSRINGQKRIGVAAVDAGRGHLLAWNPDPDLGVLALAAANGTIYVGGTFSNAGAFRRSKLAAIDTFGNVLPWDPSPDNTVRALTVSGSTVYAGGHFDAIGGQPRSRRSTRPAVR